METMTRSQRISQLRSHLLWRSRRQAFHVKTVGERLLENIQERDIDWVKQLLRIDGIDLNANDDKGYTLLHLAARSGQTDTIKRLLEREEDDPNAKDTDGRTPLSWSAQNGHVTVVEILLQHNVDPNSKDNEGRTPLWWAIENGHEATVKHLMPVDTGTLLLLIQAQNQIATEFLLSFNPRLDQRNDHGRTALHLAALWGHVVVTQRLILLGADIDPLDDDGMLPIQLAMKKNNHNLIHTLMQHNASTKGIMAKEWRDAFGKQNEDVILLSETPDGRQSLEFPAISRLDVLPLSSPGLKNRLFLLNNAIWPQLPTIVGYDQPSMNCLQITKSKNNNIVDISISLRLSMNQYANSSADIRESRIVWRAIQPISSSSTSTEMVYLSTLPIGWIPDNAMDLFQQFIAQIKTDWLEVCSRFGKHLSAQRLEQLALKGKPSSIIDCLAQDAQRLTVLRSDLAGQVYKAEEFMTKYCARYNADQIPKSLITLIKDDLETGISKEIENLALTLNDILQTEFALVSIYEARLSTKLAQNVMLLTYVSIFYLPLGFCAALWAIPDMTDMSTRMPFILTATVVSLVTLLVTFSLDRIAAIMLRVYQLLKDYIAKKCGRIAAKWKEWKKK